jgi:hypothetical protein
MLCTIPVVDVHDGIRGSNDALRYCILPLFLARLVRVFDGQANSQPTLAAQMFRQE